MLTGPAQGRSPPAWIAQRGGVAVQHRLSFEPHLAALARQPAYAFTESLWGSWLRVDLPRLLPAVASALARRGLLAATQLDTVLWTDPDVLFRADVTACGLPVPRILSIGPEAGFGLAHNYGVVYFNVSGYSEHFDGLLAAAAAARWEFDHDQALLSQHFGTRVGLLPDALNWKPYWGAPAAAFRPAWLAAPVRILHFHGPKLSVANCMLERMRADARAAAAWAEQERVDVFKACGGREAPNGSPAWMHVLVNLVFGAFDVDQGALYNESASMVATYVAREEA